MPAESIEEQIFANVKTTLETIEAGTDYWYTPGAVTRVDQWDQPKLFDVGHKLMYLVRDTSESIVLELRKFGYEYRSLEVTVLCAYKDERSGLSPHSLEVPYRGTIRHRMIRDVSKVMAVDGSRGALAVGTRLGSPSKDFEEGVRGWVLAEVPINIEYEYPCSAP